MMILMWSNIGFNGDIGFKLSARMAFPGNFQPLKVHVFSVWDTRRGFHFTACSRATLERLSSGARREVMSSVSI